MSTKRVNQINKTWAAFQSGFHFRLKSEIVGMQVQVGGCGGKI